MYSKENEQEEDIISHNRGKLSLRTRVVLGSHIVLVDKNSQEETM